MLITWLVYTLAANEGNKFELKETSLNFLELKTCCWMMHNHIYIIYIYIIYIYIYIYIYTVQYYGQTRLSQLVTFPTPEYYCVSSAKLISLDAETSMLISAIIRREGCSNCSLWDTT